MSRALAAAKTRAIHVTPEDLQLVAKDHQLHVLAQVDAASSDESEQTAQQQIREREQHGPVESVRVEVLDAIRTYALPAIEQQLAEHPREV